MKLVLHRFLEYYVFNSSNKAYYQHKKRIAISRIYHCNLFAKEKFYVQLLLTVVQSLQSFEHLRIINKIIYDTFKETYIVLELIYNNQK